MRNIALKPWIHHWCHAAKKSTHSLCLAKESQEQKTQKETTHYLIAHLIPGFSSSVTLDDSSCTVTSGRLAFRETWYHASAFCSVICNIFSSFKTTSDSEQLAHEHCCSVHRKVLWNSTFDTTLYCSFKRGHTGCCLCHVEICLQLFCLNQAGKP